MDAADGVDVKSRRISTLDGDVEMDAPGGERTASRALESSQ